MQKNKTKAISLLSGGLDSMLAAKLLQQKGIEVIGITFTTPFFGAQKAQEAAKQLGIRLIIKDITKLHLKMLKNPEHGYGKNMNPCIDCHGLMFKIAKQVMKKEKAQLVATGEVLGQRPMSQNEQALKTVEKIAGLEGQIVRPLGEIGITGRSRKKQMELAKKFNIKEYPSPAGGCVLTDPGYSEKLELLFEKWPKFNANDAEIIKYGRVSWSGSNLIVIGRDEQECNQIKKLAEKKDIILELKDIPGPVGLVRGKENSTAIEQVAGLIKHYSTKARKLDRVEVKCDKFGKKSIFVYNGNTKNR